MSAPYRLAPWSIAMAVFGLLTGVGGCEDEERDPLAEFRAALPDDATLDITLPDEAVETVAGGLGIETGALLGAASQLREHTARARRFLRGTIFEMLQSFDTLKEQKPARLDAERAVWFRHAVGTGIDHLVVMNKADDGHFTLSVWVRDSVRRDWRILVFGSLTPAETLGDGRGAIWIDLDNDMKPKTQGKVVVLFATVDTRRELDVVAFAAKTDDDPVVTRGYRFREHGATGSLAFDAGLVDVHARPDRPGLERVRAITRWDASGRFRGDFAAVSDEITSDGLRKIVGSECWAAGDGTVLYEQARGLRPVGEPVIFRDAGDVGRCPAARPAVPVLPEPGAVPSAPTPPPETTLDWGTDG